MRLSCLIVDDNAGFLESSRALLELEGIAVVGVASSLREALRRAAELRPAVALVDLNLGAESGFDVARRLKDDVGAEPLEVILISTEDEADFADLIDASPAIGFVPKAELSAKTIRGLLADR
jgi:DNA-binding NarL/FixJ family response regulator